MAIRIIEGCIGSGKTYFAVWHVAQHYYNYDSKTHVWTLNDKELVIYSNIDLFQLSKPLTPLIEEAGGLECFFNKDYQKKFIADRKVIYIIDEAQSPVFFHRRFYNPDVSYFFQYSRHFGVDIYLITQDVKCLAREFRDLAEFHVVATQRAKSLLGEFRYSFMVGGQKWKSKVLKPKTSIFALYKSMNSDEVEKIGSASRRYAVIFVFLLLLSGLIFYYGLVGYFFRGSGKVLASSKASVPVSETLTSKIIPTAVNSVSQPQSAVIVVQPVLGYSPPLSDEKYIEVTVSGMVNISETGYSSVFFIDSQNREFNVTGFDFDSLCKCNTFARLKAGDTLQILEPPKGSKYRRVEKHIIGTEGVIVVPSVPS